MRKIIDAQLYNTDHAELVATDKASLTRLYMTPNDRYFLAENESTKPTNDRYFLVKDDSLEAIDDKGAFIWMCKHNIDANITAHHFPERVRYLISRFAEHTQ
jgi:hypothetical protein